MYLTKYMRLQTIHAYVYCARVLFLVGVIVGVVALAVAVWVGG